jgi:hypothetical protein
LRVREGAWGKLDHHQNVEAAQEDRVDVDEVDGEDRVGLRC